MFSGRHETWELLSTVVGVATMAGVGLWLVYLAALVSADWFGDHPKAH